MKRKFKLLTDTITSRENMKVNFRYPIEQLETIIFKLIINSNVDSD